jgi:hypothetical protein
MAALLLAFLWAAAAVGTEAELYFSADKNGETRVTKIQEGDQIWIVVHDPDEDIDCDVRDKVWTDIKVIDAKTGAHIVWKSYVDPFGADIDGDGKGETEFGQDGYVPHKGHWPGASAGWLGADYLEETNRATGLFVSERPFQIGTRVDYSHDGPGQAHIVGPYDRTDGTGPVTPTDFQWGGYLYAAADKVPEDGVGDDRVWVSALSASIPADPVVPGSGAPGKAVPHWVDALETPVPLGAAYLPNGWNEDEDALDEPGADDYMLGRFENMDTVVGLYVDPNDASDVALTLGKIIDTEAQISWSKEVFPNSNKAATVTVTDPDENLNCNRVEMVPVFILVNPGSWNWAAGSKLSPAEPTSATDFWALNRYGGVVDLSGTSAKQSLLWCNVYDSGLTTADVDLRSQGSRQPNAEGTYYVHYPTEEDEMPVSFATATSGGVTRVMFYAVETSPDSGVFEFRMNSIERDLGFRELNVRDVVVAYYIDPNDQDDFKLAMAYIGEKNHSSLRFTNSIREDQDVFWIGRDPVYVEVVDSNANVEACCPERVVVQVCDPHEVDDTEWLLLDEISSDSPVFFSSFGMSLVSVWDALGIGDPGAHGGYSLRLDNWTLEAFNEDSIYVRYNDVAYVESELAGLGDRSTETSFPPAIAKVRSGNDVSFAVFEVADTQVYDGDQVQMRFLDRSGSPISGYATSDCVFVEVVDPDQNEDVQRRERIAAFWDGTAGVGQHIPMGPMDWPENHADDCGYLDEETHIVNSLLGDTNMIRNGSWAKLYVLNPRNGRWAPFDLFEAGTDSGRFISVTCIDLASQYACAPSLDVLPGDTLLAAYQDPSNHSDYVWISIRVSIGGAETGGRSTTRFVDSVGNPVAAYVEGEPVYVRVDDSTFAGAGFIDDAVTLRGVHYDVTQLEGASAGSFITSGLDLQTTPGETITASYVDPTNSTDVSTASIKIVAGQLRVDQFYAAPSPAESDVTFAFVGQGLADLISVTVYNLQGHIVWSGQAVDALSVTWDSRSDRGDLVANGVYIYVISASAGTSRFPGKGIVFIRR